MFADDLSFILSVDLYEDSHESLGINIAIIMCFVLQGEFKYFAWFFQCTVHVGTVQVMIL